LSATERGAAEFGSCSEVAMAKATGVSSSQLRGFTMLAFHAGAGLVGMVESMHHNIARAPSVLGPPLHQPMGGVSGLVYRCVRGAIGLTGAGIDAVLARLAPLIGDADPSPGQAAAIAALNGVVGDHMAATGNPLAIPMRLRHHGQDLPLEAESLAAIIEKPSARLVVLVHGLCMSDQNWNRNGHDHGLALERDLGYTPLYLSYNTGLHISDNGRDFAETLDALVANWPAPVEELAIIGHSMGGLVARSAYHYGAAAGHDWTRQLKTLIFLGTPHHGAPLERGGQWFNLALGKLPYTVAFSQLGRIRSAGITDLRHGSVLESDWQGRDRFEHSLDTREPAPLPQDVACFSIGATTGKQVGDFHDRVLGDGIVPLNSALGIHKDPAFALSFPADRQWVACETNHLGLLDRQEVYQQIKTWLRPDCREPAN
jgi:pimeloyl-ACP methyl ester carboxylesterase